MMLNVITIAGFVLSAFALIVGIFHVNGIKRNEKSVIAVHEDTSQVVKDLKEVRNSISTRYLCEFPDFLDEIINLIGMSRAHLVIFCDFPGYGKFSTPSKAALYQSAIEQAFFRLGDGNLDVMYMNEELRTKYRDKEFSAEWVGDTKNKERVRHFLKSSTDITVAAEGTLLTDFKAALEKEDLGVLSRKAFREAHPVNLHMPIYFWIGDMERAVFSIPTPVKEYGFHTLDRDLIKGLLEMRSEYLPQATGMHVKRVG